MKKLFFLFLLGMMSQMAFAQTMPMDVLEMIKADDVTKLKIFITKDNLNDCYEQGPGHYTILSQTIRYNARKCFELMIGNNANVNLVCSMYKSPLMFAVEYGRLDMVKVLASKGADTQFIYEGDTPLTYAEKYKRQDITDYLKGLQ